MDDLPQGRFRPTLFAVLVTLHLTVLSCFWFPPGWSWGAAAYALFLSCAGSLGVTAGYHRYWTHGSYACTPAVQYVLAIWGALTGQGRIKDWRRDHRQHHAYTEIEGDPHSPWRYPQPWGFLWAHIGWLVTDPVPPAVYRPSRRQDDDPVVVWQARWYLVLLVVPGFIVPWLVWGWTGLWWAGFFRLVLNLHFTWFVNSAAHMFGSHPIGPDGLPWTADQSRNNAWVAAFTMGEGWHGNHHVMQNSADLGREHRWDPGRSLIWWFRRRGWAWDVNGYVA